MDEAINNKKTKEQIRKEVDDLFEQARMGVLCDEEKEQVRNPLIDTVMRYAEQAGLDKVTALKYACVCLHRQNAGLAYAHLMQEMATSKVVRTVPDSAASGEMASCLGCEWTKDIPTESGTYYRSDDGESIDWGPGTIAEDPTKLDDELYLRYPHSSDLRVLAFEGSWWLGPISDPPPPLG